jgi:hypothetical protein
MQFKKQYTDYEYYLHYTYVLSFTLGALHGDKFCK